MSVCLPQKKFYRQRAHSNPMADHTFDYPVCPQQMDWSQLYPEYFSSDREQMESEGRITQVEFADIGCGYGGLLVELSPLFPDRLILEYCMSAQQRHEYLPNFFTKGQLSKMFFLFPDPHFKKTKHKWRIISPTLLAEYAYTLRVRGLVYTMTDVEEVNLWMVKHFTEHPLFSQVSEEELKDDIIVSRLGTCTEEGKKVQRNGGKNFLAVFRRVEDPS
ncbi:hypothetical protein Q7C36_021075 [Tachysurus vachellii]|uniref:tRNA (guanine-N(7)-)-methyltransferase n=1 Tax=Tachysurus vachellii TaxID=175792 RepID=A0AA88IYQ1_TACVA|nr:hypothetical protein Q7C36_021075 [Tachysurus vachellii]